MEAKSAAEIGTHSPSLSEHIQLGMPVTLTSPDQHSRALDIAMELYQLRLEVIALRAYVEVLPIEIRSGYLYVRFWRWLKRALGIV